MKTIIDEPERTEQSYISEYFRAFIKQKDAAINSLQVKNTELSARNGYLTERVMRLKADLARLRSDNHQLTKLVADLTDELGRRKGEGEKEVPKYCPRCKNSGVVADNEGSAIQCNCEWGWMPEDDYYAAVEDYERQQAAEALEEGKR